MQMYKKMLVSLLCLSACASDAPTPLPTAQPPAVAVPDSSNPSITVSDSNSPRINGRALFVHNCASCHSGDQVSPSGGPGLGGMTKRRSKEWLYSFIQNSAALIDSGDSTAVAIFTEWKNIPMTSFAHLTFEEIDSISAYVEATYEKNKPVVKMRRVWLE